MYDITSSKQSNRIPYKSLFRISLLSPHPGCAQSQGSWWGSSGWITCRHECQVGLNSLWRADYYFYWLPNIDYLQTWMPCRTWLTIKIWPLTTDIWQFADMKAKLVYKSCCCIYLFLAGVRNTVGALCCLSSLRWQGSSSPREMFQLWGKGINLLLAMCLKSFKTLYVRVSQKNIFFEFRFVSWTTGADKFPEPPKKISAL